MSKPEYDDSIFPMSRRDVLKSGLATLTTLAAGGLSFASSLSAQTKESTSLAPAFDTNSPKAFVYTELQLSIPFHLTPWRRINSELRRQQGLLNMTWLAGGGNDSFGGFYAFDSIENAQRFVTGYFLATGRKLGVAQTSRVFDATATAEASYDLGSPYFGVELKERPGAFVYTEVQISVPFTKAPWRKRNPVLKRQPGLLAKTWLSGLHTHTLGGIDVFDSLDHAHQFAIDDFPKTAKRLNAAYSTRVFDASVSEEASRQMDSPLYIKRSEYE
ncbi:MAG: hypothetical protein KDH88_13910 [Chromatiales bacterium]|nr:hypothetical protein [Chromatiales bacterium]